MKKKKSKKRDIGPEKKRSKGSLSKKPLTEGLHLNKKNITKPLKEKIICKAIKLHAEGNIVDALKYYEYCLKQKFDDYRVFLNYGSILKGDCKFKEAELFTRKAIKLNPNLIEAYSNLGSILFELRKLNEAELVLRKAIKMDPNFYNTNLNLGIVLKALNKLEEAEKYTLIAIKINPVYAGSYINLGSILKGLGRLKEAEINTRKAIELNCNYADAYYNLGGILIDLERFDEAKKYTNKAIELNPNYADAFLNLGNINKAQEKLEEAEVCTRKSIELNPNYGVSYYNLSGILIELNRFEEAKKYTNKAIELNPNYADAFLNLGNINKAQGKLEEAEVCTRKAIELNCNYADAYYNLGGILIDLERFDEAKKYTNKAIELNPNYADAFLNLGNIMIHQDKINEAEDFTRKAIELNPISEQAKLNLALILLKTSKFKEGLELYESRWKLKNIKKPFTATKPEWSIEKRGRVLLWAEQGIGDEILFASMIPEINSLVDQLIVHIDERLVPLFKRSFNKEIIYSYKKKTIDKDEYDYQISMGSIIKELRENKENFRIGKKAYLKVNESQTKLFRDKICKDDNSKKIVGISWISKSQKNKNKSISLEKLILSINSPNCRFLNLQYGDTFEEVNDLKSKHKIDIIELEEVDKFSDIDSLASLTNACDIVVTIENITFALAGGLGIESKILLSQNCLWFNGQNELKSYWFKNQALFRKSTLCGWDEALKEIKKDLNFNLG